MSLSCRVYVRLQFWLTAILGSGVPPGSHGSGHYVVVSSGILFGFPSGDTCEANIVSREHPNSHSACIPLPLKDSYFKACGPKDPNYIRLLGYFDAKG